MASPRRRFAGSLLTGCLAVGAMLPSLVLRAAEKPADKAGIEFFEQKIRPVLVAHCYECHSVKSKIVQAGLLLDTREGSRRGGDSGPSVVPGEVDESLLVEALRYESFEMPPQGRLPDAVIADFVRWIEMGAPDPRDGKSAAPKAIDVAAGRSHWAYQPPQLTDPPKVKNAAWPASNIDRYLLAAMEAQGLAPVADADPYTLCRRLYLDLTGLPPTPDELETFVAAFGSPHSLISSSPHRNNGETNRRRDGRSQEKAVASLVDKLLASPRFGERWGRHWLDVARYAESVGKERNSPYRMAWRYRDYVIDAFNADKPFDEFIREQLAGDLLPAASVAERDEHLVATGFLAVGPKALSEPNVEQFFLDIADEQVDATCRAFLATTAGCARCHDHKFDPIPTADYYALIGIFRSTETLSGMIRPYREFSYGRTVPLGDDPRTDEAGRSLRVRDEIAAIDAERIKNSSEYRAANRKDGGNPERTAAYNRRDAALLGRVAAYVAEAESVKESERPDGLRFCMGVRERSQPADFAIRIRGELADVGPLAPRGFLSVLTGDRTPAVDRTQSGRRQLAEWIAARDNPLTARVLVNRLWQHLFGKGLVTTVDDFGLVGDRPSRPELLDRLAIEFMDDGWSVKRMIRRLVLSRVYRLSNRHDDRALVADPDNRLLWRFERRRLEAELIRDSVLASCGRLDLNRPIGSRVLELPNTELGASARRIGDNLVCRSVYLPLLRGNVPESLALFDVADPSLVVGRREVTTVAPQALFLMNSDFVLDSAEAMAVRLLDRSELGDPERVELAYRRTLSRPPSDVELREALAFIDATRADAARSPAELRSAAWTGLCQALLGSAEFRYVY